MSEFAFADGREPSRSYISPKVKLVKTEDRGRILVASKALEAGEVIISEEPYAFVVAGAYREYVCAYCCQFCSSEKAFVISSADNTKYCSEHCITLDYLIHSLEIEALQNVDSIQGSDACRLVVRVAATRKFENLKGVIRSKKEILQSHPTLGRENIYSEAKTLQPENKFIPPDSQEIIRETSAALAQIATKHKLPLSSSDAEHFIYAIHSNAHQIMGPSDNLLGVGLFPFTSMMNHSCHPNCSHSFLFDEINSSSSSSSSSSSKNKSKPIPRLVMKTLKSIKEGEELCYSYVRLYQTTASRRKVLSSVYSFICNCHRCENGGFEDKDEGNVEEVKGGGEKAPTIADDSVIGIEDLSDLEDLIPDDLEDKDEVVEATTQLLLDIQSKAETLSSDYKDDVDAAFDETIGMLFDDGSCNVVTQGSKDGADNVAEADGKVDGRSTSHTKGTIARSGIHPCHIVLFKVYIALFRHIYRKILQKSFDHSRKGSYRQLVRCISLGLLVLGSIHKFTATRQAEVGKIEEELCVLVEEALKIKSRGYSSPNCVSGKSSSEPFNLADLLFCIFDRSSSNIDSISEESPPPSPQAQEAVWMSGFVFLRNEKQKGEGLEGREVSNGHLAGLVSIAIRALDNVLSSSSSSSSTTTTTTTLTSTTITASGNDNSSITGSNLSGCGSASIGTSVSTSTDSIADMAVLAWLAEALRRSFEGTFSTLGSQ